MRGWWRAQSVAAQSRESGCMQRYCLLCLVTHSTARPQCCLAGGLRKVGGVGCHAERARGTGRLTKIATDWVSATATGALQQGVCHPPYITSSSSSSSSLHRWGGRRQALDRGSMSGVGSGVGGELGVGKCWPASRQAPSPIALHCTAACDPSGPRHRGSPDGSLAGQVDHFRLCRLARHHAHPLPRF